ncbi:MAG TPA: hypothetical protein VNT99_13965 [Methylomirabilota bacterium]|nr:hypothetical protein [Methylomirabilota bacterium]
MKMNLLPHNRETGSGLLVTIVMMAIALAALAAAMAWSANTTRLNERTIQYTRSLAAAEANTEAVIAQIARDFWSSGAKTVFEGSNTYRNIVLTNGTVWKGWEFSDANNNAQKTFVDIGSYTNYIELDSIYAGLRGYVCPIKVVSNARLTNTIQNVVGTVAQSFQLTSIPIFQFAMFSSGDMEISCGQPFKITGKVHANKNLYVEPDKELTFESDVTAVGDILFQRHPLDDRSPPAGVAVYKERKEAHVPSLTLPIGTNNSPLAIREIIQKPPVGEAVSSPMGKQRYYNLADLIITVTGGGTNPTITASTGIPFSPKKNVSSSTLKKFAYVNTNFFDWREKKRVRPLELDIKELTAWSTTISWFGSRAVSSIYVSDQRVLAATELAAVRLRNGTNLPANGLTVVTARPLYVWGHYNQKSLLNLGTTNTTTTVPASIVADAITVLSTNWQDSNSMNLVQNRNAKPTTVNAALLTGSVDTTLGLYSGGMENFPRFMETWDLANTFTYNGSMVKMFPSQYATNTWENKTNVYSPPARAWAYDLNFDVGTKLPPLTPSVQRLMRGQWAALAPYKTTNSPGF